MVESTATAKLLYRGFIIQVRAKRDSSGRRSVFTHINYHVPELKPTLAERLDERETVETSNGEFECMRTYDTIGPHTADSLTCSKFYRPEHDNNETLIQRIRSFLFNEKEDTTPKAISTLVREAVTDTQDNIDTYIENHSIVAIEESEVRHGLEQSVSEPLAGVNVNTPELNLDTEYDRIRPEPEECIELTLD